MSKAISGSTAYAVVLAFSLSACAGGGGGGGPSPALPVVPTPTPTPPPPPPPPPPPTPPPPGTNYDTAEYEASNYAVTANAISAYNAGATGTGVKIGIVDSGINPNLAEFTGRIDPASGDATDSGRGVSDEGGHGTAVSAVAAAARNGQNAYLMAVGVDDQAPNQNGTQYIWSGTSFSAPTISGAVALMAQAFPNLSGKQIVQLLFNNADDLGAAGVDSVYGNGALDLARAFAPQGQTSLANSQTPVSLTSNGNLPAVAGDAKTGTALGASMLDGH